MKALKKAAIEIDHKVLAELVENEAEAFRYIV